MFLKIMWHQDSPNLHASTIAENILKIKKENI